MKKNITFISKILCFVLILSLIQSAFAVFADNETNLALKKNVEVSRVTEGKLHAAVTNGDKAIRTSKNAWNVTAGDYIVIDLGSKVDFNQVIIYEYSKLRGMDYKLEVSTDKKTWKTVKEKKGLFSDLTLSTVTNAPHYACVISFDKINAQYVKFTVNNTDNGICYIEEIEVYNSASPDKFPGEATETSTQSSTSTTTGSSSVEKPVNIVYGNYAAGKPVTVSRVVSGKNHAKITDGDKAIRQTANAWNVAKGDHVIIDLEESRDIDLVVVYEYAHQRAKDYVLELSTDMQNWKTVANANDYVSISGLTSAESNAPHYHGKLEFEKTPARYVKLTIKEVEGQASYIEEIEVFDKSKLPAEEVKTTLPEPKIVSQIPFSKENFHIYLCIGQSNMNGRDKVPNEDMVVLDRVYLLNKEGKWENAQPYSFGTKVTTYQGYNRYSTVDEGTNNGMNPATSFARALENNLPNEIGIGIISNARGGTSIEKWQKGSGENLYEEAVRRTKEAISMGGTLKGILWLQGESCAKKEGYLDKLNTMVENMRSDIGVNAKDVPFIASEIIQSRPEGNVTIRKIAEKVENSDYVSSKDTATIDNLHYNAESQRLIGVRFAEKILSKVYGKNISSTELYNKIYKQEEIIPDYEYKIKINGKYLITDVEPLMYQDRLFVPLRAIFEALGANVGWEDSTQTVTGTKGNNTIIMQIGNQNAKVNGQDKVIDVAPMLHNSRTLIPIRFVSESLGAEVSWDESTNTASIALN